MKTSASSRSGAHAKTIARATKTRAERQASAEQLDQLFDAGSDALDAHIDWSKARRPGREVQRVNVDFPLDLLRKVDAEAARLGVTRQAFIKMRLADSLAPSPAVVRLMDALRNALERSTAERDAVEADATTAGNTSRRSSARRNRS